MSEGRVTVSVVQITQETQTEGLMVGKSTDFRLPGADYSQTLRGATGCEIRGV